jgi:hypothetical protein
MKLTNERLISLANALEMLSPAMGNAEAGAIELLIPDQKRPKPPRVKGNLSYPILAYRIGRAKIAIAPALAAFQEAQRQQMIAHRIRPETTPEAKIPPEEMWPSDGRKVAEAMQSILAEDVDLGELKPLTWDILRKAGIVGSSPAKGDEIEFDGSFVAALGDFLDGEPPEDVI